MDFIAICIAILLWLVRPQDWLAGMAGVGFMSYAMMAALAGLWLRPQGVRWKMFFQSPADYCVLAYLVWIVVTTGDYFDTTKKVLPLAAFYYATALALNTPERLQKFLSMWVLGLCVVTVFALSTVYGFEFAEGSAYLTSAFEGRLALNTWIYNNPNALGHGVVVLITLAYVWLWWKRPFLVRPLGILAAVAAGYCVLQTASKGAYLCGAATLGIVFLFRKRLVVLVLASVIAMTSGIAAIKTLPRMDNLSAGEDGIAGRLVIWQMAYNAMETTKIGEGWKKFEAWVMWPKIGPVKKATHGSFVNVGADLGYPGLFLFLSVLFANARTLFQARPPPDDVTNDRIQRALLTLLVGYAASAWMIDRAYHTDFFFIAGAIAAFHRQMTGQAAMDLEIAGKEAADETPPVRGFQLPLPQLFPISQPGMLFRTALPSGMTTAAAGTGALALEVDRPRTERQSQPWEDEEPEPATKAGLSWRRIGVLDVVAVFLGFQAVLFVWHEIMTNFISF